MKITRLGPPRPVLNHGFGGNQIVPPGGSALQVLTSDGSNGRYWGENVARITSNGSNTLLSPYVNLAAGSNTAFAVSSNTLTITALGVPGTAGPPGATGAPGSSSFYLDTYSTPLDGTFGDDFDEASLNARWTRRNISSGWETYQGGGGTWLQVAITSATVDQLYTQSLSGVGDFDFICSMTYWVSNGVPAMYGLFAITSTGAGRGPLTYTADSGAYHGILTAYQYTSNVNLLTSGATPAAGRKVWYRLTRVGTTVTAYFSFDGANWGRPLSATDAATFDRIAIGRVFGTGTTDYWLIDRFDRVA